jgi:hypothetical protein
MLKLWWVFRITRRKSQGQSMGQSHSTLWYWGPKCDWVAAFSYDSSWVILKTRRTLQQDFKLQVWLGFSINYIFSKSPKNHNICWIKVLVHQSPTVAEQLWLRLLDADLSAVMKSGEDFNWERISFVLEAGHPIFFCGMFGYVQPRYSVIVIRNVMVLGMLTYPQKMHYLFSESYPADPWGTPGLFHLTEPRQGSQCSWEEFAGSLFSMGWRSQGRSIEIWSWSDFDPWFLLEAFTFFAQSII